MSTTAIQIVNRSSGQVVEAVLHESLSVERILQTEASWGPVRVSALQRLLAEGCPEDHLPQHFHWDWSRKIARLGDAAYRCLGVECDGEMQGMMMVATTGHLARLPPDAGQPLVYVEFLETAPWNVQPLVREPRFSGVGGRLFEAVVLLSSGLNCDGRVGLHALPQAEPFYRGKCLMTVLGADPDYSDLPYYELTREQAASHLGR